MNQLPEPGRFSPCRPHVGGEVPAGLTEAASRRGRGLLGLLLRLELGTPLLEVGADHALRRRIISDVRVAQRTRQSARARQDPESRAESPNANAGKRRHVASYSYLAPTRRNVEAREGLPIHSGDQGSPSSRLTSLGHRDVLRVAKRPPDSEGPTSSLSRGRLANQPG